MLASIRTAIIAVPYRPKHHSRAPLLQNPITMKSGNMQVTSGIDSLNSTPVKKQASTVLSTSSAKLDTSSAILKEDDVDDVSWFFENDSQYSDKAWDTDSTATGNLAGKRVEVSLYGCEQERVQLC